MAAFRLARPAEDELASILAWSEERFDAEARRRYARLAVQAFQDIADDPRRPGVRRVEARGSVLFLYHLRSSRGSVPEALGRVRDPRHMIVFMVAEDGVVEILGLVHDRMLKSRAMRRIAGRSSR